jgi:uncharacterized protein YceH (UPF0502 family)
MNPTSAEADQPKGPFNHKERRVLGVLIEKQKTTPESYPMTLQAITTGCNQKSNREPVTNFDPDDVEEVLEGLRRRGIVLLIQGVGRAEKWRHNLYDGLDLRNKPAEMAIIAELLLRGPQTEGELRGRASRMDAIPDLPTLQTMLEFLTGRGLVVYLTPPGQKRGVVVTHGLYPPDELEKVRQAHAVGATEVVAAPALSRSAVLDEVEDIRREVASLREVVRALADEVTALKSALGD